MSSTRSTGGAGLALVLTRRFVRSGRLRTSSATVLVAAALVTAWYCLLQAQTLSGEQRVDRDLGIFGAAAGPVPPPLAPGSSARETLTQQMVPVAGPDAQVALVADIRVHDLQPGAVSLWEMGWEQAPFWRKFELLSGRWPRGAGEVVIVNPRRADRTPLPRTLRAYGGQARFTAVGTVDDRFSRQLGLLAGPGTWAGLSPRLAADNPNLVASPILYWDGQQPDRVLAALTTGLHGLPELNELSDRDSKTQGPKPDIAAEVRNSYLPRTSVAARQSKSWIAESPAGYTIPSILLPLAAVLLGVTMALRRLRPALSAMASVGVRKRTAVAGVTFAISGWFLAASGFGALLGLGIGSAAAYALSGVLSTPIPSLPPLAAPVARILLVTLAGCLAGGALAWRQAGTGLGSSSEVRSAGPDRHPRTAQLRSARRVAAALALGIAVFELRTLNSAPEAMLLAATLTIGVLLVLSDITPPVLQRLPERHLRTRLAKRQLVADTPRAVAAVAALTVLISLSTGFVALLDTMIRTAGTQVYPDVLPGQLELTGHATDVAPVPAGVLAVASTVPALRDQTPVKLHFLAQRGTAGQALAAEVRVDNQDGLVYAVDTRADAERLAGVTLDEDQRRTLESGGLVRWDQDGQVAPSAMLRLFRGDTPIGQPRTLPAARLTVPQARWQDGRRGVVLRDTANSLSFPVIAGALMYTRISDTDAGAARAAVEQAGLDVSTVLIYRQPPAPIPPVALYLTAAGVAAMALILTLSLTRAQVRTMRDYLGHLITLGLPVSWARSVVVQQHLVLVGVATVLGLALGLPTALLSAAVIPGFELSIPWRQLALLLAATYAAALLATLLASRRLTAGSRIRGR